MGMGMGMGMVKKVDGFTNTMGLGSVLAGICKVRND
jgi:hypothetical protein